MAWLRALRWFHTARHLDPRQLAAWTMRRVRLPRRISITPHEFPAVPKEIARSMAVLDEGGEEGDALLLLDHRFRLLNVERRLPEIDWSVEYVSPLWTYNLHYFDHALELARAWRATGDSRYGRRFVDLWSDWLDAAARGEAAIEPYPTSVRCLNALRSLWLVRTRVSETFAERLLGATRSQLAWLADNVESHLRANHLQKNLTALAWGSLAFRDARWSRYLDQLWDELREQVLPDGVHFERSPMYHAGALDDFLRTFALCRAAGVEVPGDVAGRLADMTRALQLLSRPDDTLHLFNDAANGELPSRTDVVELARQVLGEDFREPSGAFALEDAGYFGSVDPDAGHRLVIDAGPLGPSYQPGHAHCDMLSFELDFAGRPIIVDSGVHGYDGDPFREYVRSSRAHNTVGIDGRDQHEMWATFRVARRGEIVEASCREGSDGGFDFEGTCRHYHHKQALHRRAIELRRRQLVVSDQVEGADGRPLTSWLHLHPDFRLEATESGFLAVTDESPALTLRIEPFGVDQVRVRRGGCEPVQGWYCPEFGVALPAPVIAWSVDANDGRNFGYRLRGVAF